MHELFSFGQADMLGTSNQTRWLACGRAFMSSLCFCFKRTHHSCCRDVQDKLLWKCKKIALMCINLIVDWKTSIL